MEIPKKLHKKLLEKYRISSIKTFSTSIQHIMNNVFNKEAYDPASLYETKKINKYIEKLEKVSSRKNYIAAVLAFLRAEEAVPEEIIKIYSDYFKILAKENENLQKYKNPSQVELDNLISYSKVFELRDEYKKIIADYPAPESYTFTQKQNYQKYLILCLYTYIVPLRGEMFFNSVIISVCNPTMYEQLIKATNKNIIDLKQSKLISGIYKTSSKYGLYILDIPKPLIEVIIKWYRITKGNSNLLVNLQDNKPMTKQVFTNFLNSIFYPKKISSSMLRKIYISEKLKTLKNVQERKELAQKMQHDITTQELIYSRFRDI
jgi:hypothetical protein